MDGEGVMDVSKPTALPDIGSDRFLINLSAILFLIAAVASLAIAGISDAYDSYDVFPLLSLPFVALGVLSFIVGRRWIALAVAAVACLVIFLLSPTWGYIALYTLVCTRGIAQFSASLQRRLIGPTVETVMCSSIRPEKRPIDRLAQFVFRISGNVDTRVMSMESSIRRDALPWDEFLGVLRMALVPCLMMWTVMFTLLAYHMPLNQAYVAAFTVCIYAVALAMPWVILRTLDVRAGSERGGVRLYDGVLDNATAMAIPLFLVLLMVAVNMYTGYETVVYIIVSMVVTILFAVIAYVAYYFDLERDVVAHIARERYRFLPEDGGSSGARPDDGIPGTPERNDGYCFGDQRY